MVLSHVHVVYIQIHVAADQVYVSQDSVECSSVVEYGPPLAGQYRVVQYLLTVRELKSSGWYAG
jgi:hypothetical protein